MKAPKHLAKSGKALWEGLVTEYRIADAAGLALATTAAECLDRLRAAQALVAEHGEVVVDRYGGLRANPANKLEVDARNGLLAALRMLNLDIEIASPHRGPGRPARGLGVTEIG